MQRPTTARQQFLDGLKHPLPHRYALDIAGLYQLVYTHGRMDRGVRAVLVDKELGGPVDVDVFHTTDDITRQNG